ncbi:MAG: hypothetical protein KAI83_14790 [Thiomargarita sp.]|nr:hypothetical protein [Thiomargarita sp.]
MLGKQHFQKDIEALDIEPRTNQIFAAAGDDGTHPGHLYKVNARTGGFVHFGKKTLTKSTVYRSNRTVHSGGGQKVMA